MGLNKASGSLGIELLGAVYGVAQGRLLAGQLLDHMGRFEAAPDSNQTTDCASQIH